MASTMPLPTCQQAQFHLILYVEKLPQKILVAARHLLKLFHPRLDPFKAVHICDVKHQQGGICIPAAASLSEVALNFLRMGDRRFTYR